MPSPPRQGSLVRERIVEAAVRMFAQQGYHATSTREIALAAGVNENTLFRHFVRKEDLFWLALQSRLAGLEAEQELKQALDDGRGTESMVRTLMEILVGTVEEHPETIRLLSVAWLELNAKSAGMIQEALAPSVSLIRECLARSVRNPQVRAADSSILTSAIMASVLFHGHVAQMLAGDERPFPNRQQAVDAYSQFWLAVLDGHSSDEAAGSAT